MRVPLIKPADLTEQQKLLYEDMKQGIAANFQGFTNTGTDGALLGPWNPWLHEPKFGKPVWELVRWCQSLRCLPVSVKSLFS
jgi:4-carboxymuconolactone decarboxylase